MTDNSPKAVRSLLIDARQFVGKSRCSRGHSVSEVLDRAKPGDRHCLYCEQQASLHEKLMQAIANFPCETSAPIEQEPQSSNCGDAPRKLERPTDPRYGSELAWLIEMSFDGMAHWWYGSDFIADANQAIRFCREQDANQVILERGLVDAKATEHMWCGGPAHETPAPPADVNAAAWASDDRHAFLQGAEFERSRPETGCSDELTVKFPRVWAPYLQAIILGALGDFEDGDCRWHLNELQKKLGSAA